MTFKQDDEETAVLFRVGAGNDVVAVFPTEIAGLCNLMGCYAHVGQHGSCDLGWYQTTRPATPAEYADLKAEIEGAPYGYRLKVYRRMSRQLRDVWLAKRDSLWAELLRARGRATA